MTSLATWLPRLPGLSLQINTIGMVLRIGELSSACFALALLIATVQLYRCIVYRNCLKSADDIS